jgi:predicted phage terminase large subunit-like protein
MSTKASTKQKIYGPCSRKQQLVLMDNEVDVLLTGGGAGSGKTHTCIVKALKYAEDPEARIVILRLTYPMLMSIGGIVEEANKVFADFNTIYKVQAKEHHFPNGAMVKFVAMPTNLKEVQGWQPTHVIIDEGAEFTLADILALQARIRSTTYTKYKLSMTITCNPDRASWLYDWVEYSLDPDTGIPKPGTEDIIRWYVILSGKIHWGTSAEQLYKDHGEGYTYGDDFMPMSFRFIPMTIEDNPVILKHNPRYKANLLSQSRVSQLRYLYGSWTAVPEGSSVFNREWVKIIDYAPPEVANRVRSWDLAYSIPSETYPNPDWTVGVKMSRTREGRYVIEDVVRFRKLTDGVLKTIIDTSDCDGKNQLVTYPRDNGGGKANSVHMARLFSENGMYTRGIPISAHSSKMQRFLPFCSLAESGSVDMVRGPWNEEFLSELERFVGDKKMKDDQVDATSDAFNILAKQTLMPTFSIPDMTQASPIPSI